MQEVGYSIFEYSNIILSVFAAPIHQADESLQMIRPAVVVQSLNFVTANQDESHCH
jgi:hypothetical protein